MKLESNVFSVEVEDGRLISLRYPGDPYETDFAGTQDQRRTGDVLVRYEYAGACRTMETCAAGQDDGVMRTHTEFTLEGDRLVVRYSVTNHGEYPALVTDLGFPLAFHTDYVKDTIETYQRRVVRHSYVAGHGSFAYFCRPNGEGPFLLVTPVEGTALEFTARESWMKRQGFGEAYYVFAHGKGLRSMTPGDWYLPVTDRILLQGETIKCAFAMEWVADHSDVQTHLPVAVEAVPGYTVPFGALVRLAVRTPGEQRLRWEDAGVCCELEKEENGYCLYRIRFSTLGEHQLRIGWAEDRWTVCTFFATRPLEELICMRASHLAGKQQYRGPAWYDGLISSWYMTHGRMTTPDDRMGLYPYAVTADDPMLCKAPFIALKNCFLPVQEEIDAVEYYIDHYVWGGLQRKDTEMPFPYGIYGSDTWKENRESGTGYGVGGVGMERMWRTFDYTHMIMLYACMYRVAKRNPAMVHSLSAEAYLERAFRTALAFYEVPYNIRMGECWDFHGWTDWAYKQGNFHELYIPVVIDALEQEGRAGDAALLRMHWETKCKYMLLDHPYPYASEMYFDSTAYESTQCVAHYALTHPLKADRGGFYDKNEQRYTSHEAVTQARALDFLERQTRANLACRQSVAPHYSVMGSDIRGEGNAAYQLSYMTQMGGWALMDYALYYAPRPEETLRIGYASFLAPWCLINSGEGYPWWGREDNRGAAAWAFNPTFGPMWSMEDTPRGPWPMDGEIDNGFSGGLWMACSILTQDSLFGLTALGAEMRMDEDAVIIKPWDGVRRAFHAMHLLPRRFHLRLEDDALHEIRVDHDGRWIRVGIENRHRKAHDMTLLVDDGHEHRLTCHVEQDVAWITIPWVDTAANTWEKAEE